MPILNVKDSQAHAMAAELARRTGKTLTDVVKEALQERLARERVTSSEAVRMAERVLEIARRAASRPVLDQRTPDEILGYDESGVPR